MSPGLAGAAERPHSQTPAVKKNPVESELDAIGKSVKKGGHRAAAASRRVAGTAEHGVVSTSKKVERGVVSTSEKVGHRVASTAEKAGRGVVSTSKKVEGKVERHVRRPARRARAKLTSALRLTPGQPPVGTPIRSLHQGLPPPEEKWWTYPVAPQFSPAGNVLLPPRDAVAGEPGYADYVAPGVSATVPTGKNTSVTGAFSLPGFTSPPPRPYEHPITGDSPAAAAGVKVTRGF